MGVDEVPIVERLGKPEDNPVAIRTVVDASGAPAFEGGTLLGGGCWVLGAGCWCRGAGCWCRGAECWGAGCWGAGCRGAGCALRVEDGAAGARECEFSIVGILGGD